MGIPSHLRGRVWVSFVGNALNLTEDVFEELMSVEGEEEALLSASLDIARTWPQLKAMFSEGGAYYDSMLSVLSAYAAFRREIGYVQSMSFVAGMFILNMDDANAFICLANVLEKPMMRTFLTMNLENMQVYVKALDLLAAQFVPKLHEAFVRYNIPHEAYLTDWIMTVYSRYFPLDTASRIWDLWLAHGDWFLFATAIGWFKMNQHIAQYEFDDIMMFLRKTQVEVDDEELFKNIKSIKLNEKRFHQTIDAVHKKKRRLSTSVFEEMV